MEKKLLNKFIGFPHKMSLNTFFGFTKLKFGDYILFQEYTSDYSDKKLKVSRPILAIYLGCFACDQTIGFNYVEWFNDYRLDIEPKVKCHIEWHDYIDILGYWEKKPNWKEIIKAYRMQNPLKSMNPDDIDWSN